MDTWIQVPLNWPAVRVLSTQRTEQGHWLIRGLCCKNRLEGEERLAIPRYAANPNS